MSVSKIFVRSEFYKNLLLKSTSRLSPGKLCKKNSPQLFYGESIFIFGIRLHCLETLFKNFLLLRVAEEESLNLIRVTFVAEINVSVLLLDTFNANFHSD